MIEIGPNLESALHTLLMIALCAACLWFVFKD